MREPERCHAGPSVCKHEEKRTKETYRPVCMTMEQGATLRADEGGSVEYHGGAGVYGNIGGVGEDRSTCDGFRDFHENAIEDDCAHSDQ